MRERAPRSFLGYLLTVAAFGAAAYLAVKTILVRIPWR